MSYRSTLILSVFLALVGIGLVDSQAEPLMPLTVETIGRIQHLETMGRGTIGGFALSPDERTLAVSTTRGVWLYDALDLVEPPRFLLPLPATNGLNLNKLYPVAFSPDNRTIAVGGYPDQLIHIVNTDNGEDIATIEASVSALTFHPNGHYLVYAEQQGIALWDNRISAVVAWLNFSSNPSRQSFTLVISPDGRWLTDGFNLWDLTDLSAVPRATGFGAGWSGESIAFSDDSRFLALSDLESAVMVDVENMLPVTHFSPVRNGLTGAEFSPDGTRLVTATGYFVGPGASDNIQVWDVASGEEIAAFGETLRGMVRVEYTSDGRSIYVISQDVIQRWNAVNFQQEDQASLHTGEPKSPFAFSPSGDLLAAGFFNGEVRVWNKANRQENVVYSTLSENVFKVIFSGDGRFLAASANHLGLPSFGAVVAWDIQTKQAVFGLSSRDGLTRGVRDIAFHTSLPRLGVTSCGEWDSRLGRCLLGLLQIWNIETGVPLQIIEMPNASPGRLRFSPDGERVAVEVDQEVHVLDLETSEVEHVFALPDNVREWTFTSNESLSALIYNEETEAFPIRVWSLNDQQEVPAFGFLPNQFSMYASDGRLIFTIDEDRISFWDAAVRQHVHSIPIPDEVRSPIGTGIKWAGFSPDGFHFMVAGMDGTVYIWGVTVN